MVAAYLFRPACRRFAGCRLISHALVFRGGVDGYNEHQSRHLQIESRVLKTPNLVFGNRYARALYEFARRTPNGNPQPIENPSAGPEALTAATQLVSSDSQGRVVPRERISL